MKDLIESVINSLDGKNTEMYPFIPYLLQDLWEMGSSSENVLNMLNKNDVPQKFSNLNIFDLGCGKGGISIPIVKKLNASVTGVDGMADFIADAVAKSKEWGVENKCNFLYGDIRSAVQNYSNFNIIILGSIGNVLGDVKQTLSKLEKCLVPNGYVLLDDAYIPDELKLESDNYLSEKEFYNQIKQSNFDVIEIIKHSAESFVDENNQMFNKIKKRAGELSVFHPDKKHLFKFYLASQTNENLLLEKSLQCFTVLLKKKN